MLNPQNYLRLGAAAVLGILALTSAATATTIVHRTLDEMVRDVDQILVGEIVSVDQVWGAIDSEDELVFTHAVMRVDKAIKGDLASGTVELHAPGGAIGTMATQVPGSADLAEVGRRMIVFLWDDVAESNYSNVAYWSNGQFKVTDSGIVERTGQTEAEFVRHLENRVLNANR